MRNKPNILRRALSLCLVLAVLLSICVMATITTSAAEDTEYRKTYDIAVAFDNSGSMYENGNKAWAKAKYAMEIFASMLDYNNGDKLTVFPMWEVTTDGTTPKNLKDENKNPIEIRNKSDIDKLSRMYTSYARGTPFTPVEKAYEYLSQSSKTEKWLIILTDGAFDGIKESDLRNKLLPMASNGIKVQYLRFAGGSSIKSDESQGFYASSCNDDTLMKNLIGICNQIFRRDILASKYLSGKTLKVDLSMKKIIVFVQGQGAAIKSLKDSSGKSVGITLDSGQRKYSDVKYSTGRYNCVTDDKLYGQVVTFDSCTQGEYTLDYVGSSDAIQIFYEPDVKIKASFKDSDGNEVDGSNGEIPAGEYTVTSKIVDSKTGADVTNHELLGKNVTLKTYVKTSNDSSYKEYENGATIVLEPDNQTDIYIEGRYLEKYKISTKEDISFKWLSGLKITEPKVGFQIDVKTEQTWYTLKDHNEWKPIRVDLTIDGQPLTPEQFQKVNLNIDISKGLNYRLEPLAEESAYNVYIAQDGNGKYVKPEMGKYTLKAKATFTDEFGTINNAKEKTASFKIDKHSIWMRRLIACIIILIILIILGIISYFLHKIKVFPKNVEPENSVYKKAGKVAGVAVADLRVATNGLFKKTGFITVRASKGNMSVSLEVEATHPLFKPIYKYQKPKRRGYKIVGISANGMDYVKINGTKYTKDTYADVSETAFGSTTIEFEKRVNSEKVYLKTDLESK